MIMEIRGSSGDTHQEAVTSIFRKDKKQGLRNYRAVGLISIPRKIPEQVFREVISMHMKDKKVIGEKRAQIY